MVISRLGRGSPEVSSNGNETQSGQGFGWRMTPIGDNQLAHLGMEKCSESSALVMSYLEFILRVRRGGGFQYVFSSLRHLQDPPFP